MNLNRKFPKVSVTYFDTVPKTAIVDGPKMIVIAGNSHKALAEAIVSHLSVPLILAHSQKFKDQEWRIQIPEGCCGRTVVLIQSTSNPANDHLMELLLLADTVKRAGASHIIAVIPYFGYSRQDRPSYAHGPISASLVANLIEACGINRILTVDLHSRQSEGFFRQGVHNLDPLPLFASHFRALEDLKSYVVVSPDVGGLPRAQKFANMLSVDLAIINKSRQSDGECLMSEVIGKVRDKKCILVDDIIDTGGTLCKAAHLLREKGARSVSACAAHGVLSGDSVYKINQAKFESFYLTDSIQHQHLPESTQIIPLGEFIANSLTIF